MEFLAGDDGPGRAVIAENLRVHGIDRIPVPDIGHVDIHLQDPGEVAPGSPEDFGDVVEGPLRLLLLLIGLPGQPPLPQIPCG